MKVHKKRSIILPVYFTILLVYLETVFHLYEFKSLTTDFIFVILFSGMVGMLLGAFAGLLPEKISFVITVVLTSAFCLFFCVEMVYKSVFQNFLAPFGMLNVAGQAFDFMDVIGKNILGSIGGILLLLLPIPLFFVGRHFGIISLKRCPIIYFFIRLAASLCCYLLAILALSCRGEEAYGLNDIYYHNVSQDMTLEKFGVITMARLDALYAMIGTPETTLQITEAGEGDVSRTGQTENAETEEAREEAEETEEAAPESEEPLIDTSPNVLNIDFDSILASAPDDSVVQLTQYFQSQTGTNKNAYTGLFEGYNVIFITAEGFSEFVIDEERTPTLYRLKNEGFVFENFYTPLWYGSTSGGEYVNLTGLTPPSGVVAMKATGKNQSNMYFTLGRQLGRLGYTLNAFHNNSTTYYGRDLSHPNMGYNWYARGNWFEPEYDENGDMLWPQSDLQLALQSMDMYMDSEPFHTYYMTVSGHVLYEPESNDMAERNYDAVADLPYSETTKGYLACQLELEKMMEAIVSELERRNIADHTVIVLSADHIPYNDKAVCDELAGHELDSGIEWYQNDLIIWSGSMEEPVVVDKYCDSLDILPTISNLLGLDYDSRMMLGEDIFSDTEQFVYFPEGSFITGKCIYNAVTGEVQSLTGEEITQEYLDGVSSIIYNKTAVSKMILEEDYYQYVEANLLPAEEEDLQ